MLYSVGYSLKNSDTLIVAITENRKSISEVYFSFGDFPNGRNPFLQNGDFSPYEAIDKQREDLKRINALGIDLNLLLNGNCYGKDAQSRGFFCKVGDTLEYLTANYNLTCVTTTSPLIAKFIKENFPDIKTRASVNMEIGTIEGMDYIAPLFDGFYLKREYNRDIEKIKKVKGWCLNNGKKLYGLANSGCLNFCSVHTFHDNLVSHEGEISAMDNAYQFEGQCKEYLNRKENRDNWLMLTNFIRPEDTYLYEDLFDGMKLATRVSRNPAIIVNSYCKGSFSGAISTILEPDHSALFYPEVLDNKSISPEFAERVMKCSKNCDECGFCRTVQQNATLTLE